MPNFYFGKKPALFKTNEKPGKGEEVRLEKALLKFCEKQNLKTLNLHKARADLEKVFQ